jgi:hypothetical protein
VTLRHLDGQFFGEITRTARANGLSLTEAAYLPGFRTPPHWHAHAYFCLILEGVSSRVARSCSSTRPKPNAYAPFALYLQHEGLVPVVEELQRRSWRNKRWRTRKGSLRGGKPFTRNSLHQLLTNVTYRGQIRYRQEVHTGEHPAIVDPSLWQQVQALLQVKRPRPGARLGNGALLQGRLRCARCGCAMVSSHTTKGSRRYRYYLCSQAQKRGWKTCPAPSVPAGEIERLVSEQIRGLSAGSGDEASASRAPGPPVGHKWRR